MNVTALVRDTAKLAPVADPFRVVVGDSTDPTTVADAVVTRFIRVSDAAIDVPGDRNGTKDKAFSPLLQRPGRPVEAMCVDKPAGRAGTAETPQPG